MKNIITLFVMFSTLTSCSTLHSTTTINPMDSFILGNNQHSSFKVQLKNTSNKNIEVYLAPIDGGKHSFQTIKPDAKANIKVDSNTAIFIQNKSTETVSVKLKVTGDVGLSMGYKN